MSLLIRIFLLTSALLLSACGGGGGASGCSGFDPTCSGGTTTQVPTLSVVLSNSTVTSAAPVTVTAVVKDATGAPASGVVVSFTTQNSLGTFSAQTSLTNSNGIATVTLSPSVSSGSGADTVVASATVGTTAVTGSAGFSLVSTSSSITSFTTSVGDSAATPIGAYGQAVLTIALSNVSASNPVTLSLSSSCAATGKATLSPTTLTVTSSPVTVTYKDTGGCGATLASDTLTAAISGTSNQSQLQLYLSSPAANNIVFVSATPQVIYLQSTGLTTSSQVVFQVNDAANNPLPGQQVTMNLSTFAGGINLNGGQVPVTQTSDNAGRVTALVNSGTVPTPVRVTASLPAPSTITTVSSSLGIAVGLPSERNFSLSQRTFNIEGMNLDGTANSYTIIASDRLGNPVPDGTSINFVAEGGQVQSIVFTASSNGLSSATANFQSASPRPSDGRISVLAYALGEKSFVDSNGNNVFDTDPSAEAFQDLGNPYLDTLYNGVFASSPNNQFVQQSPAGAAACNSTPPSSLPSSLQIDVSIPSEPNTCTGAWGKAYVRRAAETILSTSTARPVWGTSTPSSLYVPSSVACSPLSLIVPNDGLAPAYRADGTAVTDTYYPLGTGGLYNAAAAGVVTFYASDANPVAWNPVAAGSVITASGTTGMTVAVLGGSPVPSTSHPTAVAISYSFQTVSSGTVTVTITSPKGTGTTIPIFISQAPPPGGYVNCP